MIRISIILILFFGCDSLKYRKGEVKNKESVINSVTDLFSCFKEINNEIEIKFLIQKLKSDIFSDDDTFGLIIPQSTISEFDKNENDCFESKLSKKRIPMLMLVDKELLTVRGYRKRGKWIVIPNEKYR